MLLVLWILPGKEFEHELLLFADAQSEGDRDDDEHNDTEDSAQERGAKRRKHDAGIDGMAHEGVRAGRHQLVMFFHRRARTPVAPEIDACPNGEADADCGKRGGGPADGWRRREDAAEEDCSRGTGAAGE